MELTANELWDRVLEGAREALPEQSYRTWLAGCEAVALSEDELLVEAPSRFHVEWIEDKYGNVLHELLRRALGRQLSLSIQSAANPPATPVPLVELGRDADAPVHPPQAGAQPPPLQTRLNERYSFERFVVGNNNQLAAAACHAVAEQPARMYNPLFLYGGVGLGKTHLMHAIGNHIVASDQQHRVAYVPAEQFTNELISAIQAGRTADFRRRYRQMDLLLVDDVHFLKDKEATQEEFFHTFNALYDAQKQIVLTSDRPPKEIPGLEDRLVSRFEWGLVVDLKPPDYETRVAILRKKAEDDRIQLGDEVIDFIARYCTSSVRELEGAVIKLLAYSSLTNQEIDVTLARTALQGMIRGDGSGPKELTPESIKEATARAWSVTADGLESKRRTKDLTVPRQVAMFLIKEMLDPSLVKIGEHFGGRDHSTVIHSLKKVEEGLDEDPEYRRKVEELRTELERLL